MDGPLRSAVEMAAHEIAVQVHERYRVVAPGCNPLDEEAIAVMIYGHIRAMGYKQLREKFDRGG